MIKKMIALSLLAFASRGLFAQGGGYENDALKYSQSSISGSSRTQAMAGTGVALGADISSANLNPAGLALLRKSELSFSLSIGNAGTKTNFLNNRLDDSRIYVGVPNFGVVFSNMKDASDLSIYRGGSFAITFSKINNFQNQFSYSGTNNANSIADFFVEDANGQTENQLINDFRKSDYSVTSFGSAAYNSGIIDPIYRINNNGDTLPAPGLSTEYQTAYVVPGQRQAETVLTKAGQYSWDFSYGGNIKDKFFFGIGLGLIRTNYTYEKNFNEDPITSFSGDLTNINVYDTYTAKGGGINLKGGLIYKPIDALRIGISAQTPTYYSINERFNTSFNSTVNREEYPLNFSPGEGNFNLITPAKVTPAIAIFFGKRGFITGEATFISYNSSQFLNSPTNSSYANANQAIQANYRNTLNLKAGGELRIDIFRFRLGGAYFGDPYNNPSNLKRDVVSITTGAGIRLNQQYFDVAIVNSKYNSIYQPYTLNNGEQPTASVKNSLTTFNFTYGVYF